MMSSHFQKLIIRNATGAATVGMKASKVRHLPLPFPSIREQNEIIEKLDEVSIQSQDLVAIYEQKLDSLSGLKQSLLQKAFSGELTTEDDAYLDEAVA